MSSGKPRPLPPIALPWRRRQGELPLLTLVGLLTLAFYCSVSPLDEKLYHPLYRGLAAAVLVAVGYFALCSLLNSTWIEVDDRRLLLRHGPLPLRRDVCLGRAAISAVRFRPCSGLEVRLHTGRWWTLILVGSRVGPGLAATLAGRLGCPDRTAPFSGVALAGDDH